MLIKYKRVLPDAYLLTRYSEKDGKRSEYTLTAGEDAVIYPIQSAGKPSLIRTGIALDGVETDGAQLYATLLPSITDNTGLVLLNPCLAADGNEITLRIVNLARTVQTISKGAMLAGLSVLTKASTLDIVEATAQRTQRQRKRATTTTTTNQKGSKNNG